MAVIETWLNQDLKKAVKVNYFGGELFHDNNLGNLIGVNVFSDGEPVELSGGVVGYCILATGISIPVAGTVVGNRAYIVLPDTAYSVPGPINIILNWTNGTVVTTIAAVVAVVYGTGTVTADPEQETIDAWSAQITATLNALETWAVRYDTSQSLTTEQKAQARNNIGASTSAVLISGSNYKLVIP